ncbi:MAG TPA: hypothetical protein VIU82_18430, partial [Bosea sp. (in: a-proteobacteria)]
INEHRLLIDALAGGDADKVMSLMHHHLDSVANRALVAQSRPRGRDIMDILAPYADAPRPALAALRDPAPTRSKDGRRKAAG